MCARSLHHRSWRSGNAAALVWSLELIPRGDTSVRWAFRVSWLPFCIWMMGKLSAGYLTFQGRCKMVVMLGCMPVWHCPELVFVHMGWHLINELNSFFELGLGSELKMHGFSGKLKAFCACMIWWIMQVNGESWGHAKWAQIFFPWSGGTHPSNQFCFFSAGGCAASVMSSPAPAGAQVWTQAEHLAVLSHLRFPKAYKKVRYNSPCWVMLCIFQCSRM